MTIIRGKGSGLVPLGSSWLIPARFEAHIDDPSQPYLVVVEVKTVGARGPEILTFWCQVRDWPRSGSITATEMRRVKVDYYRRLAIEAARRPADQHPDGTLSVSGGDPDTRFGGPRSRGGPGRGRAMPDDFLRQVAAVYRDAIAEGSRAPVEEVRKRLHGSRSSAGRWVGQARDAGYLGAATGPTPGEAKTRRKR